MRSATLAAALAAAALLPGERLGVGVVLVAALVAIAASRFVRLTADAVLFGALALALASLAAVRDAAWVVALDLTGAWLAGCVAVAGPGLSALVAPLVRLRGLPALAPPVPSGLVAVARGALLGCLVVTPFGVLFWTADAAFAELARGVPLPTADSLPGRALSFAVVLLASTGLGLAARRPLRARGPRGRRRLGVWEWAIPLALLDALFLVFVAVQLAVLFGSHEHVLRTAGLTYAEYARDGFWQLLAAGALTLAVVGAASLLGEAPRRAHRLLLRLLLGILCALTIVVLVSALRRLQLYEEAFGLTRLRLGADVFALWLGGIFALLMPAGLVQRARGQIARAAGAGTAAALVAFSGANPDGLIAERNVDRWRDAGRLDLPYLQRLSADAVPALAELPPALREQALAPVAAQLQESEPWSSYNLSRKRARTLLANDAA